MGIQYRKTLLRIGCIKKAELNYRKCSSYKDMPGRGSAAFGVKLNTAVRITVQIFGV